MYLIISLGVVSRGRGVGGLSGGIRLGLRVDGNSLVGDISDVSVVVVSGVLDVLGPAIGKSNRVFSGNSSVGISGLSSVEGSLGVIISNSVGERVGLRSLLLLMVSSRGVIRSRGRGVVGSRGRGMVGSGGRCVSRSSMDNGSCVVGSGVVDRGCVVGSSVVNRGCVVGSIGGSSVDGSSSESWGSVVSSGSYNGNSSIVKNSSVSGGDLRESLAVVSLADSGNVGTKSLADLNSPDLSVSLGNRLVASLTGLSVAGIDSSIQLGSCGGSTKEGGKTHKSLKSIKCK